MSKTANFQRDIAPCVAECPAHIDVPRYIGLVAQGRFADAAAVVRERIPFPGVCGYVCYRPCEPTCRRGFWEAPVAINALKRAAVERGDSTAWRRQWEQTIAPASGRSVAIVGSGPAGLTAAYYLAKRCGHEVTVFEAAAEPGGQLRLGIPHSRLPRGLLQEEIRVISEIRVRFLCNTPVSSLDELVNKFDAVFLAAGSSRSRSLGIPGEESPGVLQGLKFLEQVNLGLEQGTTLRTERRVAVIGGGNVAIDCARTARRLGAEDVTVFYRRNRSEMSAYAFEVKSAELEGVNFRFLSLPLRVEGANNTLALTIGQTQSVPRGQTPRIEPGSEMIEDFDTVVVAIGQQAALPELWGLERELDGRVHVDPATLATSRESVFAGGDLVLGSSNIINAIAHGRLAAQAVDRYLGGNGDIEEVLAPMPDTHEMDYSEISSIGSPVVTMAELPTRGRIGSFAVVEQGYTEEEARKEAHRCVRCDLWSARGVPVVWWQAREFQPFWLGGTDRCSREADEAKTARTPLVRIFSHAPYIPAEYDE